MKGNEIRGLCSRPPLRLLILPLGVFLTLLAHRSCSSWSESGNTMCLSKINLMIRNGERDGGYRRWYSLLHFWVLYLKEREEVAFYYLSFPNSVLEAKLLRNSHIDPEV